MKGCQKKLVGFLCCGQHIPFGMYNHTRQILCNGCRKKKFASPKLNEGDND